MNSRPHGFVWPAGMPPCGMCDSPASDTIHITPGVIDPILRPIAASVAVKDLSGPPRRAHAYVMKGGTAANIPCLACNQPISSSLHPVGMPSGVLHQTAAADNGRRQTAFVGEIGDRLVFAARGRTGAENLPPRVAEVFREKSAAETANLWISGRYVEADSPNRNAAYWSTEDLQIGQPSVAHGPINWLHEERHIIGAIAASEMVHVDRESAGEDGVGNHIVALGAVWPFVYPQEARIIADASGAGNLWFSMECVSRAVACLADDCSNEMTYADYMREKASRCDHMKDGAPRRFVDPVFEGAGIIVPPVRPGWAKADARVLMPQAAALAERQAAAFEGMPTSDAETLVAQLISAAENPL